MRLVSRSTLAVCIALLMAAVPATAVRVDPIAPQTGASSESSPPPVGGIEDPVAVEMPPLFAASLILDRALAALDAHLLITGRPVELEDSKVDLEPDGETREPVATPLRYHPATLFEVAMGAVIVLVAISLAWLPSLRRERSHRHRRRRRDGRDRRRTSGRSARDASSGSERRRVRRRRSSRRAAAD